MNKLTNKIKNKFRRYIYFNNGKKMKVKHWKKITYDPYEVFHKTYGWGDEKEERRENKK